MQEWQKRIRNSRNLVVLSGAGMSKESGIPTFRDAHTGYWTKYKPEDLASADAWQRNADEMWRWYHERATQVLISEPNLGHYAVGIAGVRVITQNVDNLHERGGSADVAHLHGSLFDWRCSKKNCNVRHPFDPDAALEIPACTNCGRKVRPGVVWFGEALPSKVWKKAAQNLRTADVVITVGTSGLVEPAASMPYLARQSGAYLIEVNPTDTEITEDHHVAVRGTAAEALPELLSYLP